jgi:class III poly(R)-hydroxyalkanoic acid synthase PhaE subunit
MGKDTTQWSAMANDLMDSWAETSTQVWKSWFDMIGAVPTRDIVEDAKPELKYMAQRLVDNQELLLRFLQLSFSAWKDILPKVEAGQNWQQSLKNYTEQMRQQLQEFSVGSVKATQDVTQLWQLYLKETQKFSQLWTASLGSFLRPMSKTISGTSEPWIELNNLYWNLLYEESFGSLMQSPILGPSRELAGKLLRGFDAWTNLYRASLDYQVVLGDVQIRSFEELMRQLVAKAEKGEKIEDWREFQQLWSQVADDVFAEEFCGEDNLKVRGKFLNALNTYRLHQQELLELWMKAMNMPLRSEVDEMHKSIYELGKEVKQLKKALAKYEG